MAINGQRFLLLTVGLLFCVLGCSREHGAISMLDDHAASMEMPGEPVDVAAAFAQNILPILTARCALSGCHVADGPHGLDFRTYESFITGGEHGPAFIPGDAQESEVVKQITAGTMPPKGPPLSAAEIQLFVDWINQQKAQEGVVKHEHSDEHEGEEVMHHDMDGEHADEEDADGEHVGDVHGDGNGNHNADADDHDADNNN